MCCSDLLGNPFHAFFVAFYQVKHLLPGLIQLLSCHGRGPWDYPAQVLDEQYLASAGDGVSKLLVFLVMRVIHRQLQLPQVYQHSNEAIRTLRFSSVILSRQVLYVRPDNATNRLIMATALALS